MHFLRHAMFVLLTIILGILPRISLASTPAADEYNALITQFEEEGGARAFAPKFLKVAKAHPSDPSSVDALLWVVKNVRGRRDTSRAISQLADHHINSEKLEAACNDVAQSRTVEGENLLRTLIAKSPHRGVQAMASFQLLNLLTSESGIIQQLAAKPELAKRVLQYYGRDYGKHLASLDAQNLEQKREMVLEQMKRSFSDYRVSDSTLGSIADRGLFAIRHLSVGRTAPNIQGTDILGESFKLSDYRGKVVMLTFWGHW